MSHSTPLGTPCTRPHGSRAGWGYVDAQLPMSEHALQVVGVQDGRIPHDRDGQCGSVWQGRARKHASWKQPGSTNWGSMYRIHVQACLPDRTLHEPLHVTSGTAPPVLDHMTPSSIRRGSTPSTLHRHTRSFCQQATNSKARRTEQDSQDGRYATLL